jgi:hypothetical protein
MMFYDVPMNRSVSTEDSRGLTSYSVIKENSRTQSMMEQYSKTPLCLVICVLPKVPLACTYLGLIDEG